MHNVSIKIETNFLKYYNEKYSIQYDKIKTYLNNIYHIKFPITNFILYLDGMMFPVATLNFLFYKNQI